MKQLSTDLFKQLHNQVALYQSQIKTINTINLIRICCEDYDFGHAKRYATRLHHIIEYCFNRHIIDNHRRQHMKVCISGLEQTLTELIKLYPKNSKIENPREVESNIYSILNDIENCLEIKDAG